MSVLQLVTIAISCAHLAGDKVFHRMKKKSRSLYCSVLAQK